MSFKRYLDKVFVVESSNAIIRDDQLEEQRYVAATTFRQALDVPIFTFPTIWTNKKGPNACWRHGEYLGPKLVVNIVGFCAVSSKPAGKPRCSSGHSNHQHGTPSI